VIGEKQIPLTWWRTGPARLASSSNVSNFTDS